MGLRAWWSRPAAIVRCQNCRAPIARELAVERAFCSETCLDSWISETAW